MTTPVEIRELIANGRIEKAVQAVRELTKETDLADNGVAIARRRRTLKSNQIKGILSYDESNREEAIISNSVLQLLNEYEIYNVKVIKDSFDQLKTEMSKAEQSSELDQTIQEITDITNNIDEFEYGDASGEQKKEQLGKVSQFLNKLADPESKAGKAITMVKNGIDIAQDIAASYNSVAEWVGLPVVPRLFLKKID